MDDDIIKNIRLIESLKCEILEWIGKLFYALNKGTDKAILQALSYIIMQCYFLGNKVGITFHRLDEGVRESALTYLKERADGEEELSSDEVLNFLRYYDSRSGQ